MKGSAPEPASDKTSNTRGRTLHDRHDLRSCHLCNCRRTCVIVSQAVTAWEKGSRRKGKQQHKLLLNCPARHPVLSVLEISCLHWHQKLRLLLVRRRNPPAPSPADGLSCPRVGSLSRRRKRGECRSASSRETRASTSICNCVFRKHVASKGSSRVGFLPILAALAEPSRFYATPVYF